MSHAPMAEKASSSPPEPTASVVQHIESSPMDPRPPSSCAGDDSKLGVVVAPQNLVTIIRAADVSEDFKTTASAWPVWDSKTHPQKPKGSGKFPFDYNGDYDTERVLITSGRATLTPDAGGPELSIGAGDAVYFHRGFKCMWHVHEPMKKHYAYYGDDGEEMPPPPGISCDICGVDCFAESYLHTDETQELDICPKCFKKGKAKYAGAELQREGEPVPIAAAKKKQKK